MFKDMQMTRFTRFTQPEQILGLLDLISDARHILPPEPSLLEIGVWNGESTVLFSSLTHDIYVVDSFKHYASADPVAVPPSTAGTIRMFEIVKYNFHTLNPHATLFHMSSDEYFSLPCKPYYDMIYIDGEHTAAGVEKDVRNALRLEPIVLAGHDYSLPGVQTALRRIFNGTQRIKTYRDDSWMLV